MIRKLDKLGRVVFPKEWRNHAGLKTGDEIKMSYNEETRELIVKRAEVLKVCTFCGEKDINELLKYKKGIICKPCLEQLLERSGE